MKRYLPFLILAVAISAMVFSAVQMGHEQPMVIYYDGAHVVQKEQLAIKDGKAEALFSYNPVANTVVVLSPTDFLSYTIKTASQRVEGLEREVVAYDSNGKAYEGTMISSSPLTIRTKEGVVVVSDIVSLLYKGIESLDDEKKQALLLFFQQQSGSIDALFSYITPDISWKPVLTLDEGAKMGVKLSASVSNSGDPLSGRVRFVTQQVLPYSSYYRYAKAYSAYNYETGVAYESASAISAFGERYSYEPSHDVLLDEGTTLVPLKEGTQDFYTYYKFVVPSYSSEILHPGKHVAFRNTFAPLPAGSEVQYLVGSAYMNTLSLSKDIPVGEEVDLEVASAFDITANTTIITDEQSYSGRRTRYHVVITNYKDSRVPIRAAYQGYGDWKVLAETADHVKVNANEIYWEYTLGKGEKAELDFTIEYIYNTKPYILPSQ
ncbi:MAG: hypothetical protein QW035_02710 [Candidatus Anstonellales archaeon]